MSLSFSTPSSAPATSLTGGFNFGANKPATPGFGLTATSQPSTGVFGSTPASSAPAFGTPSFGAATPAFGTATPAPAFGAATPAFGTGTPAFGATSSAPTFGAAKPAFGTTATPSFGATTATGFGATTATGFGATAAPAFGASSAPTFGATTTPAFGTAGAAGGLNFGTGTNTTGTGLTFGTPAATTSAGLGGLGGFGFGATTASQSTGFGLLGAATSTTSSGLFGPKLGTTSVTGTQPSTLATPSFGLGGANTGIGAANTTTDTKGESPKQTKLPNEISTTVESFKEFVKKQKAASSEVMRVSIKPLHSVSVCAAARLREAAALGGGVAVARAHARRLRAAAAAALAAAEPAAQQLAALGSELEGSAPPQYVKELIAELEQQLITFRRQMDVADKQMQAAPKLLTEQELTLGMRRMHSSLVALAARLQAAHAQVQAQRDQYTNLRKYILKDTSDVFHDQQASTSLDQILRDADSSKKKVKTGFADMSQSSAVLADPRAALGNIQQLAGPTPFGYTSTMLSSFPAADTTGVSWQAPAPAATATTLSDSSFQLQKPSGKRGKQ